jgi:glutamine synthetase
MVFNREVMKERLPEDVYKSLKHTIQRGDDLDITVANVVAEAMKNWAIEKGATHYTHWFQPMTGITAEKHDSFVTPTSDGKVIMSFSGKELIKGEPDASSFPSGGLRATFEARGYTAWDPTSPAFVKEGTLYIPTAFCSYGGAVLDKKTPLLRSMQTVAKSVKRILEIFGKSDLTPITTVGAEQEYFLIPKEFCDKREDLKFCGRTLFGAPPPKRQEMDDHYFGAIKTRVKEFMDELDIELWKLGVMAKTEHNEAAPAQHELAPIYSTTNIACDHNQLTMEMMKKVAERHNLVCLLHEKPFAGVNGSGKHNNWSLSTTSGVNLLEPGDSPEENLQFLLFITAVIAAVDEYAPLLRLTVASAGNDYRLGSSEAPPAIVSIFLGDELTEIFDSIEAGRGYDKKGKVYMDIGADVLPKIRKDNTDRNRTSPFAFTGNKFEFRMLGSSLSIAEPNIVLNTIVSDVLDRFADRLSGAKDLHEATYELIRESYSAHKRVIFNGNGYSDGWYEEAERRGLPNFKTSASALPELRSKQNVELFERHGIFTSEEVDSRCEIMLENLAKTIHIEALTLVDMVNKEILPSVLSYIGELAKVSLKKSELGISAGFERDLAKKLSALCDKTANGIAKLERSVTYAEKKQNVLEKASAYDKDIRKQMEELRENIDEMERKTAKKYWSYPTYADMLFYN